MSNEDAVPNASDLFADAALELEKRMPRASKLIVATAIAVRSIEESLELASRVALLEKALEGARSSRATPAEQAEGVRALTADDADMVWPDDDGESMFDTIDDAVAYIVEMNWPDTTPLEAGFQLAKRIPTATIRIFNITENGHEWEVVPAAALAASSNGERGESA